MMFWQHKPYESNILLHKVAQRKTQSRTKSFRFELRFQKSTYHLLTSITSENLKLIICSMARIIIQIPFLLKDLPLYFAKLFYVLL